MGKSNPDVLQGTLDLLILKRSCADRSMVTGSPCTSNKSRTRRCAWKRDRCTRRCTASSRKAGSRGMGTLGKQPAREILRDHGGGQRQLAVEEKKWASLTAGVASVMRYA